MSTGACTRLQLFANRNVGNGYHQKGHTYTLERDWHRKPDNLVLQHEHANATWYG